MDLATIIGKIGAFSLILTAMAISGGIGIYLNTPALIIVLGGTIMVVLMKFSIKQFFNAINVAACAFFYKIKKIHELIDEIVNLAKLSRKNGLLSLENFETNHKCLKQGIQLLVDGNEIETVNDIMYRDLNLTVIRHQIGINIFRAIAEVAPAMGMIGTLIGLVKMLSSMDSPEKIGPAMAVALLTTLYGAMIAHMLANPIADKLELRNNEERQLRLLIIDGLNAVYKGLNPKVINEMLICYLSNDERNNKQELESNYIHINKYLDMKNNSFNNS